MRLLHRCLILPLNVFNKWLVEVSYDTCVFGVMHRRRRCDYYKINQASNEVYISSFMQRTIDSEI